jgi:hypothetical protein
VFRPAYDSRGANEQAILRQYLVGYGYSNGYGDAAGNAEIRNRAAITRVKMLVDLGLFSAADLQDPVFSVWTVAGSTQAARLAAVVFEQASQTLNALYDPAVVGEFLRSIRTKSGMNQAQWQAYLTAKDNFIVNGRSVFEYVYMYSTNPFDTDVQRRQAANTITGWFDAL